MVVGRDGALRAVILAGLSGLLTAFGHAAGGGALPDLALLAVPLPLLGYAFVALAERTRGPLGTVAALGAGQLALHLTLVGMHPSHAAGGPSMLGMHAGVTLLMAAAVRYADAALAAVAAVLRRVVPRRLTSPPADRPLPVRPVPSLDPAARLARALAAAQPRRGPPVWC